MKGLDYGANTGTNTMKYKIDYVVLTWNSEKTLAKTLKSIQDFGSPRKIIVIDRFSSDGTLRIAKRFECLLVQTNKRLGSARLIGAETAETTLMAYVDSDVELTKGWGKLLQAAFDVRFARAGAISAMYEGYGWTPTLKHGAFGCSMARRQLILEFRDIQKYSSAEDLAFAEFLQKRKLKWYVFPVEVKHHRELTGIPDWLKQRWLGAGGRIAGRNLLVVLGSFLVGILGLKSSHAPKDLSFSFIKSIKFRYNYLIGYVFYGTYYEIDRSKNNIAQAYRHLRRE